MTDLSTDDGALSADALRYHGLAPADDAELIAEVCQEQASEPVK